MASFKGRWRLAFMPRVFLLAVIAIFSANLCLVLVKGLAADAFPLLTGIAYIGSLLPRGLSVVSALGTRPSRAMNPPLLGDGRAFIYVYEIGSEWNTKLADAKVRWWSQQYEPEYELFELLARQNVSRTDDPEMATLFYVPFFAARYLLLQHEDDTADMMKQVVEKTSQKWTELLTKIKKEYPYFARYNGQDHFAALTMDHGRCTALTFSDPAVYGEMFFLQMYSDKNYEGWDMEVKSEWATRDDWSHAKFCICPPGHSQWTSRPAKSILAGCIPINFYRDHDNPWQDELDYNRFTLNVDADRLDTLKDVIDGVLNTPGKLERMQAELEAVQEAYVWGEGHPNGARAFTMRALRRRAEELLRRRSPRPQ